MTTALELITRSLRLINQPGRGASLAPEDQNNAFLTLQELLDSESVSKQFVPGIRRHFFPFVNGQSIYTYGSGPGVDFDSSAFGNIYGDEAPIKIEYGQVLAGTVITNNELVDEYRFRNTGTWVLDANALITDNEYKVENPGLATSSTQPITAATPVPGDTYTIRIMAEVNADEFEIRLRDAAVAFETYVIDTDGVYEFDFVWGTAATPDIEIASTIITADFRLTLLSVLPRATDRLEVPDGLGSYYHMSEVDQTHYNRRFTKGTLGRPYNYLYTRSAGVSEGDPPQGELRFDHQGVSGDICFLDVLVDKTSVVTVNDTLRLNPEAIKWVRYALADQVAPEYGKELSPRAISIMDDAWDKLAASNRRINMLGVDRAIRQRRRFDINRGDP